MIPISFRTKVAFPVYAPYKLRCGLTLVDCESIPTDEHELRRIQIVSTLPDKADPSSFEPYGDAGDDLLASMANLDLYSRESIIAFCNRFGTLGAQRRNDVPHSLVGAHIGGEREPEQLHLFIEEANRFRMCLFLHEALHPPEDVHVQGTHSELWTLMANLVDLEPSLRWDDGLPGAGVPDPRTVVASSLMFIINRYLPDTFESLALGDDLMTLVPGRKSITLLGAAYYQLYNLILNRIHLVKCPMCGKHSVPGNHRSKFCPPPEWRTNFDFKARSECQQQYNQLVYNVRKAHRLRKMSVEDMAMKYGRPRLEIQGWVDSDPKRGDG